MEPLYNVEIDTHEGKKKIEVYLADATTFDEPIDILTISAYHDNYFPVPKTLIRALYENCGISVMKLAQDPQIDLRELCHMWLSRKVEGNRIYRVGCIELNPYLNTEETGRDCEAELIRSIKSYFQMLDLAATQGIKMSTIAFPFLGAGFQNVKQDLMKYPLINECIESLKRNSAIKKIVFLEQSPQKAFSLASTLEKSYAIRSETVQKIVERSKPKAFISYSTKDKKAADLLCQKLEDTGMEVWYAPRNIVKDDYATAIVMAIRNASCFITMVSRNSMQSEHVLNEIDIAFKQFAKDMSLIPIRLDDEELEPAFEYYLSRFQWMNLMEPYQESDLNDLINRIVK